MTLESARERKKKLQLEKKQVEEFRCLSAELKEMVLDYYWTELVAVNNNIAFCEMVEGKNGE